MKLIIVLSFLLVLPNAFAKTHTSKAKWTDGAVDFLEVYDGDFVVVKFPFTKGSRPTVELDSDQNLSTCDVVSAKKIGEEFVVKFALIETNNDSGFNGCGAYINRNHSRDDESIGQVYIQFGYNVMD